MAVKDAVAGLKLLEIPAAALTTLPEYDEAGTKKVIFARSTSSAGTHTSAGGSDGEDGSPTYYCDSSQSEDGTTQEAEISTTTKSGEQGDSKAGSTGPRFPSLVRNGPEKSTGSVGHPDECTPCAFYCFSLCGCRSGPDCGYCHMYHESRVQQRRQEWKRKRQERRTRSKQVAQARAALENDMAWQMDDCEDGEADEEEATTLVPEMEAQEQDWTQLTQQNAALLMDLPRLPPGLEDMKCPSPGLPTTPLMQSVAPSPFRIEPLKVTPTAAGLPGSFGPSPRSGFFNGLMPQPALMAPAPQEEDEDSFVFTYSQPCVTCCIGQPVEIVPKVRGMGGVFAVSPALPKGLIINPLTGCIAGVPQEATAGLVSYFVSYSSPAGEHVGIAMLKMRILKLVN
mmetsp:Transcript_68965/g.165495  ORF Transcript_68965/g.165495 Transcript_68965/m.165495 type:complete len:397 (+) Transcript_68965:145-1335(+)